MKEIDKLLYWKLKADDEKDKAYYALQEEERLRESPFGQVRAKDVE